MNAAETPRTIGYQQAVAGQRVGYQQASAGLGATVRMLSNRPGLLHDPLFGVGADEYGGKKLYDCKEDSFLYDFSPCEQEPGKCYRKIKPAPIALGAVGVLGLGYLLFRMLKKRG